MPSRVYGVPPRTEKLVDPVAAGRLRVPQSPAEWSDLLVQAIARAESVEDRRVMALRTAQQSGDIEHTLRHLRILCTVDIDREFPERL